MQKRTTPELLLALAVFLGLVLVSSSATSVNNATSTTSGGGIDSYYVGPASCSAHPACAHLVGNCCPTSSYGKHLDCCYADNAVVDATTTTEVPYYTSYPASTVPPKYPPYTDDYAVAEQPPPPPYSTPGFLGGGGPASFTTTAASCGLHPGCAGVEQDGSDFYYDYYDDCCPSPSGYDLYCCYAPPPIEHTGYEREFTLYGHADQNQNQAQYLTSTGQHYEHVDVNGWYVEYQRDVKLQYDMIYYTTDAISNAYDYVTGKKKFYLTVDATSAAACTQIYLQLDHLPTAEPQNYPTGRHSRYLATYSAEQQHAASSFGTKEGTVVLEFDYLDSPDPSLSEYDVNAIALFFDPGAFSQNHWVWHSLDSYTACNDSDGGSFHCRPSPLKRCQAIYVDAGECGPYDCDNPKCLAETESCSAGYATSFLALEDRGGSSSNTAASSSAGWNATVRLLLSVVLLATGCAFFVV